MIEGAKSVRRVNGTRSGGSRVEGGGSDSVYGMVVYLATASFSRLQLDVDHAIDLASDLPAVR